MQARSNVWFVGRVTGLCIEELEIGHWNSAGGSCCGFGVLDCIREAAGAAKGIGADELQVWFQPFP